MCSFSGARFICDQSLWKRSTLENQSLSSRMQPATPLTALMVSMGALVYIDSLESYKVGETDNC